MRRIGLSLALLVLALLVACEQPTVDPDQATRELLIGHTWVPSETTGEEGAMMVFYPNGEATIKNALQSGSWNYKSGVFTLTHYGDSLVNPTTDVTPADQFSVTETTLRILYRGRLCEYSAL